MNKNLKTLIAVVQFEIEQFAPEKNLKKAEQFIEKASKQKANIIVFPEDFITGPIMKDRNFADAEGKYKTFFQKLAKKYNIDIVPGSIIEENNGTLYNTSYYIDATGRVKSQYRKINLWHPERSYITQGNEISVFNTKYGKVGLIICWDLIFPETFRRMLERGVTTVICPSYWCYGDAGKIGNKHDKNAEITNVNALCLTRAFENEITFVYCNAAGKLNWKKVKDTLIGRSQITVPFKGVLKRLDHNKEEMFIQEIDMNILEDAEKVYKIRKDLKERIF